MVDILNLIKQRKTTYEFSEKKVSEAQLQKILEAARWAPSCSNMQPWHFVIIKDKGSIAKLMETTYYGSFHTEPSLLIAIVLRNNQSNDDYDCLRVPEIGISNKYASIGMTANSMVLEAESLGISSCLLTPNPQESAVLLKINAEDKVPLIIGLGFEKSGVFQKKRTRKSLKEIVSLDSFKGKKR